MENGDTSGLRIGGREIWGKRTEEIKKSNMGSLAQPIHYSVSDASRSHMGLEVPLNIDSKTLSTLNFQMFLSMVVERTRG